MTLPYPLTDAVTERELFTLAARERLARDTADWAGLADSYWPDAQVRVTWFTGTPAEFIDVSRARARGGTGFHVCTPVRTEVHGDRAIVESRGEIHVRPTLHGVQCDVVNWGRFFSRAERRNGIWRLASFDSIYRKDRLDPVLPASGITLDPALLADARDSYRFLTYLDRQAGHHVPDDLPGDDRPDLLEQFHLDAQAWLHGRPVQPDRS